jgi:hypothetical protein
MLEYAALCFVQWFNYTAAWPGYLEVSVGWPCKFPSWTVNNFKLYVECGHFKDRLRYTGGFFVLIMLRCGHWLDYSSCSFPYKGPSMRYSRSGFLHKLDLYG